MIPEWGGGWSWKNTENGLCAKRETIQKGRYDKIQGANLIKKLGVV